MSNKNNSHVLPFDGFFTQSTPSKSEAPKLSETNSNERTKTYANFKSQRQKNEKVGLFKNQSRSLNVNTGLSPQNIQQKKILVKPGLHT